MAQRENLEVQGCTGTDDTAERSQKTHQHGCHGESSLSFRAGKCNGVSAYEVCSRHSLRSSSGYGVVPEHPIGDSAVSLSTAVRNRMSQDERVSARNFIQSRGAKPGWTSTEPLNINAGNKYGVLNNDTPDS
jgi:hypothetical protein